MKTRLGMLGILILALLVGGTSAGLALEQRDEFCTSCHTEPETIYFSQSRVAPGPRSTTLAAFHHRFETVMTAAYPAPLKCIDCHGGVGPAARLQTLYELGVLDTLRFMSGNYQQPGRTHRPLPNVNCSQCHAATLTTPGFENHFHNKLADSAAPPIACVNCHLSHTDAVDPREKYIRRSAVFPKCNECHIVMGGPTTLR